MKKNPSSFFTFVLASLVVLGCTASSLERKYMGKSLYNLNLRHKPLSLSGPGHHFWSTKHLDIDYDYLIDQVAKTITFDGTIKCNQDKYEVGFGSESILLDITRCEFRLLFADIDRNVVAVEVHNIYPNTNIYDTTTFKMILPYDDRYRYIVFGYFLYAQGD